MDLLLPKGLLSYELFYVEGFGYCQIFIVPLAAKLLIIPQNVLEI